ncbi:hypothetical protein [Actinoplanes sp. HUAS TT8]|uniref:hypothetical protein n=1 Tax=Actinoplanes sp. HUAS TT8 TaxID=3447453 RepID=UPI003F522029
MTDGGRVVRWGARHRTKGIAATSFLIAGFIGVAVQKLFDTHLSFAAIAAVLVSLLVAALFTSLTEMVEGRLRADEAIIATVREEIADHRRLAGSTDARISSLGHEIVALAGSVGMKVDTMMLDELNRAKTVESDRTVQLMLTTKEEILVLDLLLEDGRWPDEAMDQSYQTNAFDVFYGLLSQSDPAICYKRIVQVESPEAGLHHALTPNLVRHCHDIMDLQSIRSGKVSLRVTRRRFPFKFIIIDRTALVIQLQEYGDTPSDLRIWGEVLVNDPGGQLVGVFRGIWDEIVDDPSTRTVTRADLPPFGGVRAAG